MSSLEPVPAGVVYDINVLVTAAAGGNSPFRSWPSPPPVSGNASADCLGIIVDAAEFALWFVIEVILVLIWIIADSVDTQQWSIYTVVLTSFYLLSRGIAKASRVLEQ